MAKQDITITIHAYEVAYEVRNKTYQLAQSRDDGENYRLVSALQQSEDSEDANVLLRCVSTAWARLRHALSEWLGVASRREDNEQLTRLATLTLTLKVPMNYNTSVTKEVASLMHRYMTSASLEEWYLIKSPGDADVWQREGTLVLTLLIDAICRRKRPSRPTGSDPDNPDNPSVGSDGLWWDDNIWDDGATWQD